MRTVTVPYAALFGMMFVLLTAVGLIGNLIVIAAIAGDKKMRSSVMNMLLFNLAVADALNLITTIIEWSPTIVLGRLGWILPAFLCPVARYLEIVFLFVSITTQLIVCVERFIAIAYPMHARRLCSRQNIFVTILAAWFFVALFAMPYALLHHLTPKSRCVNLYGGTQFWKRYKWIEFFLFYFIPCIIFVVLYSKVSRLLWVKNKLLSKVSSSEAEIRTRAEALRTRRNVVKMLVACVSIYFICYSPIQIIFLSKALFDVHVNTSYEFILLMNALALMCSACNPLLYTLFSKKFRSRITRILPLGCCYAVCRCNQETKSGTSSYKVIDGIIAEDGGTVVCEAASSRRLLLGKNTQVDEKLLKVSATAPNCGNSEEDEDYGTQLTNSYRPCAKPHLIFVMEENFLENRGEMITLPPLPPPEFHAFRLPTAWPSD